MFAERDFHKEIYKIITTAFFICSMNQVYMYMCSYARPLPNNSKCQSGQWYQFVTQLLLKIVFVWVHVAFQKYLHRFCLKCIYVP